MKHEKTRNCNDHGVRKGAGETVRDPAEDDLPESVLPAAAAAVPVAVAPVGAVAADGVRGIWRYLDSGLKN